MIKVVMVGDCHGNFKKLDEILTKESPFDFFIATGDVGTIADVTPDNIAIVDKWDNGYSIMGNHDQWGGKDVVFFKDLYNFQTLQDVHVAAFSGMIKTRTLAKSFSTLVSMTHLHNIDILVTHQPPTGVFTGMGESVLSLLMEYMKPRIYISGHIHRYKSIFVGNTFVFSLPLVSKGYAVAYFDNHVLKNIEVTLKQGKRTIKV
jgi:Icc-related predicted phosphoesterase